MLVAVAAMTSCEKSQLGGSLSGEKAMVTISADAVATTRALAENGNTADLYYTLEIYLNGELYTRKEPQQSNKFTVELLTKQNYKAVVWADYNKDYYDITNLTNVQLKGDYIINTTDRDAFAGVADMNVSEESKTNIVMYITRPFGRINVKSIDDLPQGFEPSTVAIEYSNIYKAYDVLNARPVADQGDGQIVLAQNVIDIDYKDVDLSADYLFAPEDGANVTFTQTYLGDKFETTYTFTNIPYQANYQTNVSGKILTDGGSIDIVVTPEWEGDIDVEEQTVTDSEDIVTTIADAFAAKLGAFTVSYEGNEEGGLSIVIPDASEQPNMDITINLPGQTGDVTIITDDNYVGNLTIYAPNATVTVDGTLYIGLTATTKHSTLIIPEGTTVRGLTINGGGVEVSGKVEGDVVAGEVLESSTITITSTGDMYDATMVDTSYKFTIEAEYNADNVTFGENVVEAVANCYMISPSSVADFNISLLQAREGWELTQSGKFPTSGVDGSAAFDKLIQSSKWEIVTLWRTWGAGATTEDNITGGKLLEVQPMAGGAEAYYASVNFGANVESALAGNGHNALIALKSIEDGETGLDVNGNEVGTIYWSWHLWFTDYNPNLEGAQPMNGELHTYNGTTNYGSKKVMDRNLGATVTGWTDGVAPSTTDDTYNATIANYYGLLYQFGRKDPFSGASAISTAEPTNYYDADGNSFEITKTEKSSSTYLSSGVFNPTTMFYKYDQHWVNFYENASWAQFDLWDTSGSDISPFDPSPAGWRVPLQDIFADFLNFERYDRDGAYIGVEGQVAFYPTAGNRGSSGALDKVGSSGSYWLATTHNATESKYFGFSLYYLDSSFSSLPGGDCSLARSIRAVQE